MTTLFDTIRDSAAKRRAFRRTLSEIRGLPLAVAQDLGINPGDAERIARQAVYGV